MVVALMSGGLSAGAQEPEKHKSATTVVDTSSGGQIAAAKVVSKPLLHMERDRLSYDVYLDPDAGKVSMMEMMKKIPALQMGGAKGGLQFRDKPITTILIDGAENGFINARRQYPMEFIKAEYMRRIEVILPGNPEFDNTEPILVIRLKRELPYGFSGQIVAEADTKNEYAPAADVVVNTPFIGIGASYSYSYAGAPALTNTSVTKITDPVSEVATMDSYSKTWSRDQGHNIGVNAFRKLGPDVDFHLSLRTHFSDSKSFSESATSSADRDGKEIDVQKTLSTGVGKSPFRLNGAIRFDGSFGPRNGRTRRRPNRWRIEYSYLDEARNSATIYQDAALGSYTDSTSSLNREHRLNANIKMPSLYSGKTGLGMMADAGYYNRTIRNNNQMHHSNISGIDYNQQVAYMQAVLLGSALDNRLGYHAKLKAEYLANKGIYDNGGEFSPLDYRQFNVIPDAGLSWKIKRGAISLSYSRTVRRPDISRLNPYVRILDPYNVTTGNPNLKGEKTDLVRLSYGYNFNVKWFRNISVGASYGHTADAISNIIEMSDEGVAVSTYCNLGKIDEVSANFNAYFTPVEKLSVYLGGNCSYRRYTLPDGRLNAFWTPMLSLSATWINPKLFDVFASAVMRTTAMGAQTSAYRLEPVVELGISRYFSKPHIGISANITDLVHPGGSMVTSVQGAGFTRTITRERRGLAVNFRLYWRFGRFSENGSVSVDAYDM